MEELFFYIPLLENENISFSDEKELLDIIHKEFKDDGISLEDIQEYYHYKYLIETEQPNQIIEYGLDSNFEYLF